MSNMYDLVIIGGGLMGCATAYYYQKLNPSHKVIIIERNELCSAATSRAAALITIVRSKKEFIPLSLETYNAIEELENLLSEKLNIRKVGVMHIARQKNTIDGLYQLTDIAREFNQPFEFLGTNEAMNRVPWLQPTDQDVIAYMPNEAYCDPYLLGSFFARSAALLGVRIKRNCEVEGWNVMGGKICGVKTKDEIYLGDQFILATGTWSPVLCSPLGIHPPMAPMRSQYWITEKNPMLFPESSPIVILPDAQAYARPEGQSLLFGIREKNSFFVSPDQNPTDWLDFRFSPDKGMSDLEANIERLVPFFPLATEVGIQHYIAGFSGYTPDNYLTFGKHVNYPNLSIMAGCVGAGVSVCGGVAKSLAALASGRQSPYDIDSFRMDRFGEIDCFDKSWLTRCAEARSVKASG